MYPCISPNPILYSFQWDTRSTNLSDFLHQCRMDWLFPATLKSQQKQETKSMSNSRQMLIQILFTSCCIGWGTVFWTSLTKAILSSHTGLYARVHCEALWLHTGIWINEWENESTATPLNVYSAVCVCSLESWTLSAWATVPMAIWLTIIIHNVRLCQVRVRLETV